MGVLRRKGTAGKAYAKNTTLRQAHFQVHAEAYAKDTPKSTLKSRPKLGPKLGLRIIWASKRLYVPAKLWMMRHEWNGGESDVTLRLARGS